MSTWSAKPRPCWQGSRRRGHRAAYLLVPGSREGGARAFVNWSRNRASWFARAPMAGSRRAVTVPAGPAPGAREATPRRRPAGRGPRQPAAGRRPLEHAQRPWRNEPPAATRAHRRPWLCFPRPGPPHATRTASARGRLHGAGCRTIERRRPQRPAPPAFRRRSSHHAKLSPVHKRRRLWTAIRPRPRSGGRASGRSTQLRR
jgi:hypothetical protein